MKKKLFQMFSRAHGSDCVEAYTMADAITQAKISALEHKEFLGLVGPYCFIVVELDRDLEDVGPTVRVGV